ncbi:hypothetical protein [Cumulibacter soli]|uniref:hypothetical protein n=1 Tax=Cumulibacter soli TaxID=2546344 RepID=UPI001067F0EC|nr:hypothetical protein [Cumulibacter soli]
MRTREEHVRDLIDHQRECGIVLDLPDAEIAIDYAIEHGMPVAPEPVDPVVGAFLTERTRLVDGVVVVDRDGEASQYIASAGRWVTTGFTEGFPLERMVVRGARIVYVPGGES